MRFLKIANSICEAAVMQFRNLLWCEARSNGLPLHRVVVSLDTTVSDGGIDAKVEGDPRADSLLVQRIKDFMANGQYRFHLI